MNLSTRQTPRKQPGQGRGPRRLDGLALGVREAAALVGDTEKGIRGKASRHLIPFRRLGGRIIFLRSELETWLHSLEGCSLDEARTNQEARHS
jgi:hypothetical protein